MNSDELKDIEEKMRNARTMDELYEDIKDSSDEDLTEHLTSALHNGMNTLHQCVTHPRCMMYSYIHQCVSFSNEIMITIDGWSTDVLQNLTEMGNTIDTDDLIHLMDTSVDKLAVIMADLNFRYYKMGGEIPSIATTLRSFPKYLKQAIDAYGEIANALEEAKDITHKYCDLLEISHKDFDTKVAKKIMDRAKKQDSAGDNNAQPTE